MKKIPVLFIIYFIGNCLAAQPLQIAWQKAIGGTDFEFSQSIAPTSDNGFIVSAVSFSTDGELSPNRGVYDAWLIKLKADGNIEWKRSYGGSDEDDFKCVQPTPDNGFIACGFTKSKDGDITQQRGMLDYWIVKTDAQGNIQWQKTFGGPDNEVASSVITTTDGGYMVAGYTMSASGDVTGHFGKQDYWVIKLDANGNKQWARCYGGTEDDVAYSMVAIGGDKYVITGNSNSADRHVTHAKGRYDTWTICVDAQGQLQWQTSFGGSMHENTHAVTTTSDGHLLIAANTQSNDGDLGAGEGELDGLLIKMDKDGHTIWHRKLGGNRLDNFSAVVEYNGHYLVAGGTESTQGTLKTVYGKNDMLLIQLQPDGSLDWQTTFGGSEIDDAYAMCITPDGLVTVAGSTFSNNNDVTNYKGGGDAWIVQLKQPNPLPVIDAQPYDTTICQNNEAVFTLTAHLASSYQWQKQVNNQWQNLTDNDNVTGSTTAQILLKNNSQSGEYRCILTNAAGQTISNTVRMIVLEKPLANITPLASHICAGATLQIKNQTTDNNATYQWQFQYTGNWQTLLPETAMLSITNVNANHAGKYRCIAANNCGSDTSNIVAIEILNCNIPTAFSPNGDGINDKWEIPFLNNYPNCKVQVFDRNGQLLVEEQGYTHPWNGTFKLQPLPTGVYYYIIRLNAQSLLKGAVTILH